MQGSEEYRQAIRFQAPLAELEDEQTVPARPPGTVEAAPYEPEYAKYGGPAGVAVAEDLFCATSAAVADLLTERTADQAPVGDAVRIVAMSLRGSGLDVQAGVEFLRRYESWWLRYVPPGHDAPWPALHERMAPQVRNLCTAIWRNGHTDTFHDIYAVTLRAAATAAGSAPDAATLTLAGTTYLHCLSNYIHTTNNRLGIVPGAEAFIAQTLHRTLTTLR